jgi:hypothetical protein
MAKTQRPGLRSDFRLDGAMAALGLLAGAQLAAAPAAAESRGASLSASAMVLPSCVVSTQSGSASTSCSNFGDGSVRIERKARRDASSDPAPGGSAAIPTRSHGVTYLTVTY